MYNPCFNPCFPGSYTCTLQEINIDIDYFKFQSLFSWKLHLYRLNQNILNQKLQRFQSLFSWKLHLYKYMKIWKTGKLTSFNPCFPRSYTCTTQVTRVQVQYTIVSILVSLEVTLVQLLIVYFYSI